ncbi:amiloride-sensitive sodium channel subunit alpha-like [Clytia hemisphaerica]
MENRFSKTKMRNAILSTDEIIGIAPISNEKLEMLAKENVTTFMEVLKKYQLRYKDVTNTKYLDGTMCRYNGQQCGEANFTEMIKIAKLCMEFNSFDKNKAPLLTQTQPYQDDGFEIILDIGDTLYDFNTFTRGVIFQLNHYGDDKTLSFDEGDYIPLETGKMTTIFLKKNLFTTLQTPFTDRCGKKPYSIIDNDRPYTKELCMDDCVLKGVYEKVGCVDEQYAPRVSKDINICNLSMTYFAQMALYEEGIKEHKVCFNKCPNECEMYSYQITNKPKVYGHELLYQYVKESRPSLANSTMQEIEHYTRNNIVGVHVQFASKVIYKEEMEPTVSFASIFSSIGGALGLCCGFSIITGFEFLFFIYDMIKLSSDNRQKHQPQNQP